MATNDTLEMALGTLLQKCYFEDVILENRSNDFLKELFENSDSKMNPYLNNESFEISYRFNDTYEYFRKFMLSVGNLIVEKCKPIIDKLENNIDNLATLSLIVVPFICEKTGIDSTYSLLGQIAIALTKIIISNKSNSKNKITQKYIDEFKKTLKQSNIDSNNKEILISKLDDISRQEKTHK